MAGTKAGGRKAAATNKLKYGDGFYARIGKKGGQNGHTGGFAKNPELARIAGAKGGRASVRGSALSTLKGFKGEVRQETIDLFKAFMKVVFEIDNDKFLDKKNTVGWQLPPINTGSQCYEFLSTYINSDADWSDDRVRLAMSVLYEIRESVGNHWGYAVAVTEIKSMVVDNTDRSQITWRQVANWYKGEWKDYINGKAKKAIKNLL